MFEKMLEKSEILKKIKRDKNCVNSAITLSFNEKHHPHHDTPKHRSKKTVNSTRKRARDAYMKSAITA